MPAFPPGPWLPACDDMFVVAVDGCVVAAAAAAAIDAFGEAIDAAAAGEKGRCLASVVVDGLVVAEMLASLF